MRPLQFTNRQPITLNNVVPCFFSGRLKIAEMFIAEFVSDDPQVLRLEMSVGCDLLPLHGQQSSTMVNRDVENNGRSPVGVFRSLSDETKEGFVFVRLGQVLGDGGHFKSL